MLPRLAGHPKIETKHAMAPTLPVIPPDGGADLAISLCDMPDFIAPWVHLFYEPAELLMLGWCGAGGVSPAQLAKQMVAAELVSTQTEAHDLIRRAVVRGVLSNTSRNELQPSDFHIRFDYWALFEGWQDIPDAVRWQLNHWELAAYVEDHRRVVSDLRAGKPRDPRQVIPEYVLLHEAQALIERVPHLYLWPCNCRSMWAGCRKPRMNCLRFENVRGIGWEISKARGRAILTEASRKGLMHSAELGLDADGRPRGAICNCCHDCCFPHRLAEREQAAGHWPISRYCARLDPQACNFCGRCAQRCPFGAIEIHTGSDPDRPPTGLLDRSRCRGCGVCAAGCSRQAIEMIQLRTSLFEEWYQPRPKPTA